MRAVRYSAAEQFGVQEVELPRKRKGPLSGGAGYRLGNCE
jgi:hypothetical protein